MSLHKQYQSKDEARANLPVSLSCVLRLSEREQRVRLDEEPLRPDQPRVSRAVAENGEEPTEAEFAEPEELGGPVARGGRIQGSVDRWN